MDDRYEVLVTPQAYEQMNDIVSYLAHVIQAPHVALETLGALESAIGSLEAMPNRAPLTDEMPWREQGVRRIKVSGYLVYYWVDEERKRVHVVAVIHESRDQRRHLSRIDLN